MIPRILKPITKKIFKMEFEDEPPYEELKDVLNQALLEEVKEQNHRFEWAVDDASRFMNKLPVEEIKESKTDRSML